MSTSHRRRVTGLAAVLLVLLGAVALATPSGAAIIPGRCLAVVDSTDLGPSDAYGMAIDPRNGDVYVAMDDTGRVEVLDGTTNDVKDTIEVPGTSAGFPVIDTVHDLLWISSFGTDSVYGIDLATEAVVGTVAVPDAQSLALNRMTNRLYAAGQSTNVTVINTSTRLAVGTLAVGGSSLGLDVDSASNRIFVGDYTNGTLDVFNGATNAFITSHTLTGTQPITVRYDKVRDSVWVTTRAPGRVQERDADTGAVGISFAFTGAQGLDINATSGQGFVAPSSGSTLTAFELDSGDVIDTFPIAAGNLAIESRVDPMRIYASGMDDGAVTVIGPGAGPFSDVTGSHPFCFDIEAMTLGLVIQGFPDGTYRPTIPVTRQAMAAFLYRMAGEPPVIPPVPPTFSDVGISHPFRAEIEWLTAEGIADGFPDGTFRPTASISRQSMAAFLYRFAGEPTFVPPVTPTFPDVPTSHPFYGEIEWLASTHITGGYDDGTYRPGSPVTRQSAAAFLHRFTNL